VVGEELRPLAISHHGILGKDANPVVCPFKQQLQDSPGCACPQQHGRESICQLGVHKRFPFTWLSLRLAEFVVKRFDDILVGDDDVTCVMGIEALTGRVLHQSVNRILLEPEVEPGIGAAIFAAKLTEQERFQMVVGQFLFWPAGFRDDFLSRFGCEDCRLSRHEFVL
jgi:hypothetical protein